MKTMNMLIQERKEKLEILEQRKYKLIKEEKATRKVRIKNTKGNKQLNKAFLVTTAVAVAVSGIAVTGIELNAEEKVVAEKENKQEKKQEQTTTKVEKIERKQELFFAPMKENLIKTAIAPIKDVEIKETKGSVVFVSSKNKMVHSPLKGEIKKIENGNVSIQVESGEVVTIKNVTTDKVQVGEKMLQGELLGVSTSDLEIEVSEKDQKFAKVATIFNQEATNSLNEEKYQDWYNGVKTVNSFDTDEEKIHVIGKMFSKENANRPTEQMIFPSVPTAQMVLESTLMTSELAENALNLGGIKADGDWNGEIYKKLTKEQNEKGEEREVLADFKKYSSVEEYVADYYNRMQQSNWMKERYENYYAVNSRDQKTALKNIASKYATDIEYEQKVNEIIKERKLASLDANVLELATGKLTQEQLEKEIVQNFEKEQKSTEEVKEEQQNTISNTSDFVTEPFATENKIEITFKGGKTPLNKVDFNMMSEEEAKEIVFKMVKEKTYIETKNEFLEKLLKKANIEGINNELKGDYKGKYLDFLMETATYAVQNGEISEEAKKQIEKRKIDRLVIEVEGKQIVITNKDAIQTYDESLLAEFEKNYSQMTVAMPKGNLKGLKITLDAGHAIKSSKKWIADPGSSSIGNNVRSEAEINYDYAQELKQYFEAMGAKVDVLNEDGSHQLKANERGEKANRLKNDILFSVHFNGIEDKDKNGTEVVIGNKYSEEDMALANIVQKHQIKALPDNENRGIKTERAIGMLGQAESKMGDVIVEGSFRSNIYGLMQSESDIVKYSLMNSWVEALAEVNGTLGQETPQEAIEWEEKKISELANKIGKNPTDIIAKDESQLFKQEEEVLTENQNEELVKTENENNFQKEVSENQEETVEQTEEIQAKETSNTEVSTEEVETKEKTETKLEETKEEKALDLLGFNFMNVSEKIKNILQ